MYGVPLVGSTLCSALCLRGVTGGEDELNLRALDVVARDGGDAARIVPVVVQPDAKARVLARHVLLNRA